MKNISCVVLTSILLTVLIICSCAAPATTSNLTPPSPTAPTTPTSPVSQSQTPTTKLPKLLFEDDFSNPSSGWSAQSSADGGGKYENGEFVVWINKTGAIAFSNLNKIKQISDFILEVDVRKLSDVPDAQHAFFFRSDEKNSYGFGVLDTGTYQVTKQVQGVTSKLQDWKLSSDIKIAKETNTYKILCKGTQLEFYANGNKITSFIDEALKKGIIAMGVGSGNPSGSKYSFDNFKLYSFE